METLLVTNLIECNTCGKMLNMGDTLYRDGDVIKCCYCKNKPILQNCKQCDCELYYMIGWSYCPNCGNGGNPVEKWQF
jgi:hypothetical protein